MAVHETTPVEERIFSVLVENRAGVLCHVVNLFAARGFNIDSLAVGETEDPTMSRISLVTRGDKKILEQIKKQLNKLIDVIKVQDFSEEDYLDRELMLVKLRNDAMIQGLVKEVTEKYHVHVADENKQVITLVCTETRENTKKLFAMMKKAGIAEIAQTGAVALSKKPPKE